VNIQDLYHPILTHFRKQRMKVFYESLGITEQTKILDVGGAPWVWMIASDYGLCHPQITIVNLFPEYRQLPPNMRWVVADGCQLPFQDREFDVVFSNSVIEHLGNHDQQVRFAREIQRVGRQYWVQTPDPRFFIEPHYVSPFIHWLPAKLRRKVARRGTLWGLMQHPTQQEIEERIREIRLIRPGEFKEMFPGARILHERWCGMPKSLIAVCGPWPAVSGIA
jgi:hypothetical protein